LIVGGFSTAAVYLAPLANTMLNHYGIEKTLILLGIGVIIVSVPLAQLIKNPPPGYIPAQPKKIKAALQKAPDQDFAAPDFTWKEMLKTRRFYYIFFMFLIPASVGLMIIGNISKIATIQTGITDSGFLAALVSFLAVANSFGRVVGGLMSDKIGRVNALFVVFILQLLNMIGFLLFYQSLATLMIGILLVGFCYGTLASVFPSITADQYVLKNFGANYGIVFLGWGLAGVVAPVIADIVYDASASYSAAYIICAAMMVVMLLVNVLFKIDLAGIEARG
jgi:nitrate/nitrite transporter NarK